MGIIFTSFLNWGQATKALSTQVIKALNILNQYHKKCNSMLCDVSFKLFDTMVAPIVLYASEIWGYAYQNQIESVKIRFCKRLLGVPKSTSNDAILGECGRYPLAVNYMVRCTKYRFKILNMANTRYPKACYKMLYQLDEYERKTWASEIKDMLFKYGFGPVWHELGINKCFY